MTGIIKNIAKITTLSLILTVWLLFLVESFSEDKIKKVEAKNSENYKNVVLIPIANVWVAITSNIWMWFNKNSVISEQRINKDIFKPDDFYKNTNRVKSSIVYNMTSIKEYYNILKTDFKEEIKNSRDRERTLENIIKQLEIRYTVTNESISNIKKQIDILLAENDRVRSEISSLKNTLEIDFAKSRAQEVFSHLDSYYELKYKEISLRTNTVFLWEFIKRYNALNNYSKLLLDTFVTNKDIIVKNSYIVIPNSWTKILENFDLIFSEDAFNRSKR